MSEITERQEKILEIVVDAYIKSALPVSSGFLAGSWGLDVCPATVRLDLHNLSQEGFLEKSYVSGGRVPTDKGYRFFVNNLLQKRIKARERERQMFAEILGQSRAGWQAASKLARVLAGRCSGLSLVRVGPIEIFCKHGWEDLVEEPEFQDIDYLKRFMELVADFEDNFEQLMDATSEIHIFIGEECPLREKDFSLMIARPRDKEEDNSLFALLGPKRMNFKRNLRLMHGLLQALGRC